MNVLEILSIEKWKFPKIDFAKTIDAFAYTKSRNK